MNFPASLRHVCGFRSLIIRQNDQEKVMWLGRQTPYSANKQYCDLRMLQTSEPTRKTLAKTFGRQSFFYYEPHDIYIYIYYVCVCVRAPLHTYGDIHMNTHQQSGVCSNCGDIFKSPQKSPHKYVVIREKTIIVRTFLMVLISRFV